MLILDTPGFSIRRTCALPPSTTRLIPVIHSASSDKRKRIALATSSGRPRRRRGCQSFVCCSILAGSGWVANQASHIGVSM